MSKSITILYATMTGNARECAEKAAAAVEEAGMTSQMHDLALYDPNKLLEEEHVLLTISTWGDGEPPDDAVGFFDYVKGLQAPALRKLKFAVFSLGDTGYEYFCKCGKDFDEMFETLGGTRLLDRVDNDVDYHSALEEWCEKVAERFGAEAVAG